MSREKSKHDLRPYEVSSNLIWSVTVRVSKQSKETAIGKALRFTNMQGHLQRHCQPSNQRVNPPGIGDPVFFNESLLVTLLAFRVGRRRLTHFVDAYANALLLEISGISVLGRQ